MSLEEKYQVVKNKLQPDANYYSRLEYYEALNSAVGGGGDIEAKDVVTDDGGNVQDKLDSLASDTSDNSSDIGDLQTVTGQNTSDISDNASAIANLDTTGVSLLRGGNLRSLVEVLQRYSLLTVFLSLDGTGSEVTITDGDTLNLLPLPTGWTLTEDASIEGGGETYAGNTAVEWLNIYTETGVGTGLYTGSIVGNNSFKMPDAEAQTGGIWKSYGLDVSVRVEGNFTGGAFSSDSLDITFTDNDAFATNSTLLSPILGTFSSEQRSLTSRIDKNSSSLVTNGLQVLLTPTGADFVVSKMDLLIKIHH